MITEDYVSFETAKLLKEKGFNESCEGFYVNSGVLSHTLSNAKNSKWDEDKSTIGYISAPTLQMAMKWLRETHKISVEPLPDWLDSNHEDIHDGWYCEIRNLTDMSYDADYFEHKKYSTYEEACEAAIKYCLENLI